MFNLGQRYRGWKVYFASLLCKSVFVHVVVVPAEMVPLGQATLPQGDGGGGLVSPARRQTFAPGPAPPARLTCAEHPHSRISLIRGHFASA